MSFVPTKRGSHAIEGSWVNGKIKANVHNAALEISRREYKVVSPDFAVSMETIWLL